MAEDFDITLYDAHPAELAKVLKAFTITVVSKDSLQAALTIITRDDMRCDVRLTQEDAWEIAGTLATFADMKADHPSIKAREELEEAVPYGSH